MNSLWQTQWILLPGLVTKDRTSCPECPLTFFFWLQENRNQLLSCELPSEEVLWPGTGICGPQLGRTRGLPRLSLEVSLLSEMAAGLADTPMGAS